jgi:hypothetical protein
MTAPPSSRFGVLFGDTEAGAAPGVTFSGLEGPGFAAKQSRMRAASADASSMVGLSGERLQGI